MSSSVSQGLQSCLEPRLVEPRVLIQNLAPQKATLFQSIPWPQKPNASPPQHDPTHDDDEIIHNDNNNKCYYSFLDSKHQNNKDGESFWGCKRVPAEPAQQVYVHPLVKRSSSTLSTKSLEMCTESLGSETGSSIGESIDDFPCPLPERSNLEGINQRWSRPRGELLSKKMLRSASFPPPLTSISGSEVVRVKPHREGGRLVLKAVSVSSCSPYFQTERSNGRLRLSLLINKGGSSEDEDDDDLMIIHGGQEAAMNADEITYSEDEELGVNDEENVGYEVRPSRCKEGGSGRNKGIPSWEPFCVAIS